MDLFPSSIESTGDAPPKPLAERMRPVTLDEFAGQEEIVASGKPLRRIIEGLAIPSLILWGPPGTGKTTLARLIARQGAYQFIEVSAVESGVKELRAALGRADDAWRREKKRTILFIDEVHRFSKVQQDAILPHVESGRIIIIGSTTENPAHEVIPALRSRCRIFRLAALSFEHTVAILNRAVDDKERGLRRDLTIEEGVIKRIAEISGGDARSALNLLEAAAFAAEDGVSLDLVNELSRDSAILYDKMGQEHYDHASAFQKSLRGSDPDAAIYWLAKMLLGGEDPRFIARRLMVTASEDVGLADPGALLIAVAAAETVDRIGMPECRINLAHATIHVATAPKSNRAYVAIKKAMSQIQKEGDSYPVPNHLKDTSYQSAKGFGFGVGYRYPHDHPGAWVEQQYLPDALKGVRFYEPSEQGRERAIRDQITSRRKP